MKIKVFDRICGKKSSLTVLRNEGKIPAVVYVRGEDASPIYLEKKEFEELKRHIVLGRLSTTVITLVDDNGRERKTIIKEIQYHPTTYEVLHLDFEELQDNVPVSVNVPIECKGAMDCAGVKLGGVLRTVIRKIKVRCLPKDIPVCFEVDVRLMGLNDKKKLSEIEIPDAVRAMTDLDQVAVVIAKR